MSLSLKSRISLNLKTWYTVQKTMAFGFNILSEKDFCVALNNDDKLDVIFLHCQSVRRFQSKK